MINIKATRTDDQGNVRPVYQCGTQGPRVNANKHGERHAVTLLSKDQAKHITKCSRCLTISVQRQDEHLQAVARILASLA